MRISMGDRSRECMDLLGLIEYPFTSKELSTAFRTKLKEVHPDMDAKNGSNEITRKVIDSYNHLKNLAQDSREIDKSEITFPQEVYDMFDLFDICPECHGAREKVIKTYDTPCPYCLSSFDIALLYLRGGTRSAGKGYTTELCKKCFGTGRFTVNGFDKGVCYTCSGTGIFKKKCWECSGTGWSSRGGVKRIVCHKCWGKGKIKLDPFNPVIPKGAVLGKGGKR